MATEVHRITDSRPPLAVEPPRRVGILLYALSGGVAWWAVHLVALAAVSPAICGSGHAWLYTVINVVCFGGVLTALLASVAVLRRPAVTGADEASGRSPFLGLIAILFNVASLALVVLESVPVYVLDPCH